VEQVKTTSGKRASETRMRGGARRWGAAVERRDFKEWEGID